MNSPNRGSLLATIVLVAIAASNCGSNPPISVSLSKLTATVDVGATVQFTATVTNGGSNAEVSWTVTCSAPACGAVSPASTMTGASTTYTPPATATSQLTVSLVATSVGDPTKSALATVTVPSLTVSVSETSGTQQLQPGGTATFGSTVTNDGANQGVNWSVSCSAPPCGNVSPATTPAGVNTTYTAPTTPPAGNMVVTITASSATDSAVNGTANVTVLGITVSVMPGTATVAVGANAPFFATVSGDPAKQGVNWSVACSRAPCGSVSPTMTPNSVATNYTAPTAPPAGNLTVTLTAASQTNAAATGSAIITIPGITVSISPQSASVQSGGTQPFTAAVSGDPNNGGVTWTILVGHRFCHFTCGPITFTSCSTCGTVSPATTANGAPTTYTAPAHFTRRLGFAGVFLQAASVTNSAALSRASITLLPVTVGLSPASVSVALTATQQFLPTVTNDGTNSGVTWTLTQNGAACSPGCGTISPAKTANGVPATYTPPAIAPAFPLVTVSATSVEDPTASASARISLKTSSGVLACGAGSGSESLLKGKYAFLLNGLAGSMTGDGTGKLTGGEVDIQRASISGAALSIDPSASGYAVGPDHRGCLVLVTVNGPTLGFRFALGSINASTIAAAGHIIEFDDTTGTGTRAAGTMRLQDVTSFAAGQFKGSYVVGLVGSDMQGTNGRLAVAGTFAADGISALPSGSVDVNDAGTVTKSSTNPEGTFTCCDANGRGTLTLTLPLSIANVDVFVFYMINSGDAFVMNLFADGEAIGISSGTTFSQSSLNGASVLRATAQSSSGPIVDIAAASANGSGNITVEENLNSAGTFTASSPVLSYQVASNGRVTTSGETTPPVLYLNGLNQGFLLGTDPDVTFGLLEPQATGPFSDASFSGTYTFGTENPSATTVTLETGVMSANGSGNATGASDQSSSTGLVQNQALNLTVSISANGTGNVGSGTTAIVISGNKLIFINNTSTTPTITVVDK